MNLQDFIHNLIEEIEWWQINQCEVTWDRIITSIKEAERRAVAKSEEGLEEI